MGEISEVDLTLIISIYLNALLKKEIRFVRFQTQFGKMFAYRKTL